MEEAKIKVKLDGIDEMTDKAERYVELLKEAKTLADELASTEFEFTLSNQNWFFDRKNISSIQILGKEGANVSWVSKTDS